MKNDKSDVSRRTIRRLGGFSVRRGRRGIVLNVRRTDNELFPFTASNAALGVAACGSTADEAARLAEETISNMFVRLCGADRRFLKKGELRMLKTFEERFDGNSHD